MVNSAGLLWAHLQVCWLWAGCPVALAVAVQLCSASVTFLLGPAGKDRIDLVAMDDRGTRGQTLIHRP